MDRSLLFDVSEWLFWKVSGFVLPRLPFGFMYAISGPLACAFMSITGSRRKQTMDALKKYLGPAVSEKALRDIVFESYVETTKFQLESLLYPYLNADNVGKISDIIGIERLDKALQKGKGAVLLLSHFGNNEIIMPALGYRGYKLNQIADRAPPKIGAASRRISRIHSRNMSLRFERQNLIPCNFIPARGSARQAVKVLQRNEILMVTGDGRIGKSYIELPFLDSCARFLTGPVKLAIMNGSAILPVFTIRRDGKTNEIKIEDEIIPEGDRSQNRGIVIREILVRYVALLEDYVRRLPANYAKYLWQMSLGVRSGDVPMFIE